MPWRAQPTWPRGFIPDRYLPDKAVDVIDEAASRVRIRATSQPLSLAETQRILQSVRREKDDAIGGQNFQYAAELRDRELRLTEQLEEQELDWKDEQDKEETTVTREDVAEVISMWTGIPRQEAGSGGDREAASHGGRASQADNGAGRSHREHL